MSARHVLIAVCVAAVGQLAYGSDELRPAIYVSTLFQGQEDSGNEVARALGEAMRTAIRREFPCASAATTQDTAELLKAARDCEAGLKKLGLDGSGCDLKRIAAPLCNARYVLFTDVHGYPGYPDRFMLSAEFAEAHRVNTLIRTYNGASKSSPRRGIDELVDQMITGLLEYQLCPYRGTITLETVSRKSKRAGSAREVYCNNRTLDYRREESEVSTSKGSWTWAKNRRWFADAEAQISEAGESVRKEEDGCHVCSGTDRKTAIVRESRTEVKAGMAQGQAATKAGAEVQFSKDGTYVVFVEAESGTITREEKTVETVVGSCDTSVRPIPPLTKQYTVPLRTTVGPFQGTPRDKRLRQAVVLPTERRGDEEITTRWEFDLQRD